VRDDLQKVSDLLLEMAARLCEVNFDTSSTGRKDFDQYLEMPDRFKVHIMYMTPDEFLELVDARRFKVDQAKVDAYYKSIMSQKIPAPSFIYSQFKSFKGNKNRIVHFHDGQHRVLALKKAGFKRKMPVLAIQDISP
jgi:hypothetical protein